MANFGIMHICDKCGIVNTIVFNASKLASPCHSDVRVLRYTGNIELVRVVKCFIYLGVRNFHSMTVRLSALPTLLAISRFVVDEHLSFSDQITALSKSCNFNIRQLRCIRPFLDIKTASTAATSIVHSKLDYCNSLWRIICLPANTSATSSVSARSHSMLWNCCVAMAWVTTRWGSYTRPLSPPSCCMPHRHGGGFTSAADKQRLEATVRRAIWLGLYTADDLTPSQLAEDMDDNLLRTYWTILVMFCTVYFQATLNILTISDRGVTLCH